MVRADVNCRVSGAAWSGVEIHPEFVFAEKVSKFPGEKLVYLVLAPLNFKAFALIRPLPHAFGLRRYPMGASRFATQRHAQFVCTARHAVIAGLRLAGVSNVIAMTAKEVASARELLLNATSTNATVHDAGAHKKATFVAEVARRVGEPGLLFDVFPFATIQADAVIREKAVVFGAVANAGGFPAPRDHTQFPTLSRSRHPSQPRWFTSSDR